MHRNNSAYLFLILLCVFLINPSRSFPQAVDAAGFYDRAAKMASGGDVDGAIELFKKSIEKNGYYSLAHYGLGKAYLYRGKIKNAIKHLEKATDYDSRYAPAFFYLGMAYLFDKRYNASISAFSKSLKLDPSMNEALYNIGVAYDETGRTIKASIYYEKYLYESQKQEMDILF